MPKKLKKWVFPPLERVVEYLRESGDFANAVVFGIENTGRVALAEKLFQELERLIAEGDGQQHEKSADAEEHLKLLLKKSEDANNQIIAGLPILHAQLSLGIWSILEAFVDDFIVVWICNVPESLSRDAFSDIKVPLNEYESMGLEDRINFVLNEYKRNKRVSSRVGVERFELLFKSIGLSGEVESAVSKDIYELSQIRNALLHKGGLVDERLLKSCPWLKYKVKEKITLNLDDSNRYTCSVTEYLKCIYKRLEDNEHANL